MGRRNWLLAALLAALAVACAAAFVPPVRQVAGQSLDMETRNDLMAVLSSLGSRPTDTADLVPIAHTDVNPYGVNVFLNQEVEEAKIRRSLEMIRDGGFGWIKMQMLWSEIERPAKGRYEDEKVDGETSWAKYDRVVDLAREYGLDLILRLDTSPDWARPGKSKIETPPDNYDDFGDFVYAVVSRYRGKVRYYQIWNEPNVKFEWGDEVPDAVAFTRLLRIAYQRAKQADPDCVIIAPALAPTIEVSERAISDLVFLQQMYDQGAGAYFDIASTNPYGLRSGPDDHRLDPEEDVNFSRPVLLRELMVRNGDAAKPIWAAELGWNALPLDYPGEPLFGRVSRQLQAKYTARAYQRAQEEWPWMGVMNLWHFRMIHDADKQQQQYYFGIVDDQFEPFPVYEALKAQAQQLPVLRRGYHQESHWALRYTGPWREVRDERAVLGVYRLAGGPDAELRFTFIGTDLDLVAARRPGGGRLLVTVDGAPALGLPRDAEGRAYVELQADAEEWQAHLPLARGLLDGPHEVRLIAEGPAIVEGLVVDSSAGFPWVAALLALAAALAAAAIVLQWRREEGR
ncbi:MAG: cellulase family glycosylhydrolase [Bacteroidetes bacterium]|nr:cellulase family glycosylhydrolase [Bacteroidota bacterium]MCL5026011.1 cellulase family glycosylhydrolase [Chloroflexota bacterium]